MLHAPHHSVLPTQANGLVERFHRHLNTGSKWVDDLPIVLLGVRATLKEDLSCMSAEMVCGTTILCQETSSLPPMQHLQFVPTSWHGCRAVYLPLDLYTATHMYVLRDSHKHPLTLLNDGPFRILRRFDKHFTLGINGKSKEITVDRLKPAERIRNPHILRHSQLFERTLAFQIKFLFIRPSLPGQAAQVAGQHTSPIISDW